jgi:hypothetical protein
MEEREIQAPSLVSRLITEFFGGSQSNASRHFKTTRQAVHAWVQRGFLPASRVFDAQSATGGLITAEQFMDEFISKNPNRAL